MTVSAVIWDFGGVITSSPFEAFNVYEAERGLPRDFIRGVNATNPAALATTLTRERDRALLFRDLATLRTDAPLFENVDELRWTGPSADFAELAAQFQAAKPDSGQPAAGSPRGTRKVL